MFRFTSIHNIKPLDGLCVYNLSVFTKLQERGKYYENYSHHRDLYRSISRELWTKYYSDLRLFSLDIRTQIAHRPLHFRHRWIHFGQYNAIRPP